MPQANTIGPAVDELAARLVCGTVPGVAAGAVIRVEWLAGERGFLLVVALVLIPLGALLVVREPPHAATPVLASRWLAPTAFAVGIVGGIYGIGGGSILAPLLLLAGYSARRVAPAIGRAPGQLAVARHRHHRARQVAGGDAVLQHGAHGFQPARGKPDLLGPHFGRRAHSAATRTARRSHRSASRTRPRCWSIRPAR